MRELMAVMLFNTRYFYTVLVICLRSVITDTLSGCNPYISGIILYIMVEDVITDLVV